MPRVPLLVCACALAAGFAVMESAVAQPSVRPAASVGAAANVVRLAMDEARILRIETPAHAVIVGNPAIADAIVHDGRNLILTARAFGTTNIIVLDRRGEVIMDRVIHVAQPQSGVLTVQRGDSTETYACAPHCRRMPMPGDAPSFFEEAIKQNQSRNGLAQSQTGR